MSRCHCHELLRAQKSRLGAAMLKAALNCLGSSVLSPIHQAGLEIHLNLRSVIYRLEICKLNLTGTYNSFPTFRQWLKRGVVMGASK